ncbi:unnamed protein product [Cylindrotheca closterium]|uniref:TNFR-Cys domain-containing protein n=1 Tax=Cylindrotheca closterium TaxID=2856 RepID=A0AAD2FKI9_9STRA|nr:unnamed protein product [Cylindrotheca closterium]
MMACQSRVSLLSSIAALFFGIILLLDNAAAAAAAATDASSSSSSLSSSELEVSMILPTWNENAQERSLRELQLTQGKCWSTRDDRKPNRYCMFEDTPRSGAFLSLSCPTTRDDYSMAQCQCTIGIGDSQDAPNTNTCWKCGFCRDGSLAYDCRNVAEGTCIGRNCLDECLSSFNEPEDLLLGSDANKKASSFLLMVPSIIVSVFLLCLQ